ncbi:MAG TPA: ABC transporter ATP-binding protein [Acidimicrobiales bacterium]|nr:ABC transporter ATP-binding protein [Acidimicrobiales bacterium]
MKLVSTDVEVVYMGDGGTDVVAVRDLNLTVNEREVVCIVGRSGCGKSTYLHALAGLIPISSGEMLMDGAPIVGPAPERAMVFQRACLLPWRTVFKNVTYGLDLQRRRRGLSKEAVRARAMGLIELVGLSGFEHAHPVRLSGGMQQRVNLARALAVEPTVLLMDEPFGALDAQLRAEMQGMVREIVKRLGTTIVFVTHDVREALFLGDRVVVLGGHPGTVREIIEIPERGDRSRELLRSEQFLAWEDRIESLLGRGTDRVAGEETPIARHVAS